MSPLLQPLETFMSRYEPSSTRSGAAVGVSRTHEAADERMQRSWSIGKREREMPPWRRRADRAAVQRNAEEVRYPGTICWTR